MKILKINILYLLIPLLFVPNINLSQGGSQVVLNVTSPSISGSDFLEFQVSDDLSSINWTVVDDNPKSYEITMDNVVVGQGGWEASEENNSAAKSYQLSYNLLIDAGDYEFALSVVDYDNFGSIFISTVHMRNTDSPNSILGISWLGYLGIFTIAIIPLLRIRKNMHY